MRIETLRHIKHTSQFKKDLRKSKRQGKDMDLLDIIVTKLANDEPLPTKHRDHALTGSWQGFRECHVTPDWLLVYQKLDENVLLLILTRLASHSELDF